MIVAKISSTLHRSGSEPSAPFQSVVPVSEKLDLTPSGNARDTASPGCTLQAIASSGAIATHP